MELAAYPNMAEECKCSSGGQNWKTRFVGEVISNDFSCYDLDVSYVAGARDTGWRPQTQTNGLGGTNWENVTDP